MTAAACDDYRSIVGANRCPHIEHATAARTHLEPVGCGRDYFAGDFWSLHPATVDNIKDLQLAHILRLGQRRIQRHQIFGFDGRGLGVNLKGHAEIQNDKR